MLQSDYNSYPYQCILYYCGSSEGQNDPTVYQIDLSDVCGLYYDGSDNIQISDWLLGGYSSPSTVTILTYTLSDVLDFYNNFYIIPADIAANEPYMISTSDLANIRADNSMIGFVVYDTTAQSTKYWSGSNWYTTASRYLSSSGGNITGNILQSAPSCSSWWSVAGASISYTASTPKVISMGSFTQVFDGNSDLSINTSTGEVTYTGSTRYFRITCDYDYTALVPLSTQTLTHYLSKNGSTSISGKKTEVTFVALNSAKKYSDSISDIISLANNDTLQLGGEYSATASISYSNISYCISQI